MVDLKIIGMPENDIKKIIVDDSKKILVILLLRMFHKYDKRKIEKKSNNFRGL